MTDSSGTTDSVPSSGTRSIDDARSETKRVSSDILDIIGLQGKVSEPGPGVTRCGEERDHEKFFRMRHPWSFTPESDKGLDDVMKRLREELPKNGWKVVEYERDTSPNRNLNLTADNDKRKFSVRVTHYAKDNPPKLTVRVISGCYQVPEGERVDQY
ncbi:hypothetical protein [Streptomyces sp. NPDC003032]